MNKNMTFKEIYDRIIPFWGDKIEFEDGVIKSTNYFTTPSTTPTSDEYFFSEKLRTKWDKIEETVGQEDTFGDLMVWTIYQVIHKHSRIEFIKGNYSIDVKDLSSEEIEEQYYQNLHGETWEEELEKYQRIKK